MSAFVISLKKEVERTIQETFKRELEKRVDEILNKSKADLDSWRVYQRAEILAQAQKLTIEMLKNVPNGTVEIHFKI